MFTGGLGPSRAVVVGEVEDDALDDGPELEFVLEGVGLVVGEGVEIVIAIVADKDGASAGRFGLGAAALVPEGAAVTLFGGEAEGAPSLALGLVAELGGGDAVGTGQGEGVGIEDEM